MKWLRFCLGVLVTTLAAGPLVAQESTGSIRGTITDETSQRPVAGATVSFGGKTTVSRSDGVYHLIGVRAGTETLRVRVIGFAPKDEEVTVDAGTTLQHDVVLVPQAVNLSEMVVVGYGEQAAGNITGAVSNVTSEEFNTGRVVNATELIQNKVAGVQVVESNEPGGGTAIRIRGATSVNASSDPLYVVDGMPLGTGSGTGISGGRDPLNFLNPADIETITVLRDASAAAIYGSNAANGVIIITTKSARNGQPTRVEYSGSTSASTVIKNPSMLNAADFRAAVNQYAPQNSGQLLSANTNWLGLIERTGFGQEHNLTVSGAGNNNNFRVALNVLDQNGILEATNTQRLSIAGSYNQRLFGDRMGFKVNLRGSRAKDRFTPGGVLSNAAQMGPTQPILDTAGLAGYYNWSGSPSAENPIAILNLARDKSTTYRSIGNVQGDYQFAFLDGLSANANFGFDVTDVDHVTFFPTVLLSQTRGDHGSYFRSNPTQANVVGEGYLTYAVPKAVGPGLLDLTGGYSYSQSHAEYPEVQARGLSTDLLGTRGIPTATEIQARQNIQDSKLISFFGRVNYNVNDRYLAAFSVRRDGSSRFGGGRQYGTFPSASAAWRISEESFLKGQFGLSDLKVRGAWGKTGNQSFANYLQRSTYTVGDAQTQYQFGDTLVSTARPSGVDRNIKWEATRSVNFGLDFGFNNQRISGAIDWYDKKTTDLIFFVPVAAGSNFTNFITTNIGAMRNRGIELSLSAKLLQPSQKDGLTWTADFTASHNKNELLTINPLSSGVQRILVGGIAGGVGTTIQVLEPGQPINSFFVYKHIRDSHGKPIYADTNGDGTINENDLYKDLDGDGNITVNDRRPFHDPAPKWVLGHSSYITYGKLDIGFTLRAYLGNYVYNNVASNLGTYAEVGRGSPYNLNSSVLKTGFQTPQYLSDYYVEKASFLRMDNITVGYSFPIAGQSARVYGTLQNAFTITGYSGVDPTAGLNGIDNNLYPRARTFTSGLSLQF